MRSSKAAGGTDALEADTWAERAEGADALEADMIQAERAEGADDSCAEGVQHLDMAVAKGVRATQAEGAGTPTAQAEGAGAACAAHAPHPAGAMEAAGPNAAALGACRACPAAGAPGERSLAAEAPRRHGPAADALSTHSPAAVPRVQGLGAEAQDAHKERRGAHGASCALASAAPPLPSLSAQPQATGQALPHGCIQVPATAWARTPTAMITISHRPRSLQPLHSVQLCILGREGGWQLTPLT